MKKSNFYKLGRGKKKTEIEMTMSESSTALSNIFPPLEKNFPTIIPINIYCPYILSPCYRQGLQTFFLKSSFLILIFLAQSILPA